MAAEAQAWKAAANPDARAAAIAEQEAARRKRLSVSANSDVMPAPKPTEIVASKAVSFDAPVVSPVFSMMLKTRDGEAVFGTDSSCVGGAPELAVAGQTYVAEFLIDTHLAPDQYFLNCGVRLDTGGDSVFLSRRVDAAILKVSSSELSSSLVGPADLRARLSVTAQASDVG